MTTSILSNIPRYHPHWKMITLKFIFPLHVRNVHPRTDLLSLIHTYYCLICFNQSAPECSHCFLFPTALSVGDAVFLSTPKNRSLLQRFSLLMLYYLYHFKNRIARPNLIFIITIIDGFYSIHLNNINYHGLWHRKSAGSPSPQGVRSPFLMRLL